MSDTDLTTPIANCPFCGHAGELCHPEGTWMGETRRFYQVRCGNRSCPVAPFTRVTLNDPTGQHDVWPSAPEAIQAWNQRPPP